MSDDKRWDHFPAHGPTMKANARIAELEAERDSLVRAWEHERGALAREIARLRSVMDVMGEALGGIDTFAWSAMTADCEEAREEAQARINLARAALTKYREASEPLRATSEEMSRG